MLWRPHLSRVRRLPNVRDDDDDRQDGAGDQHRDQRRGHSILLRRAAVLELLATTAGAGIIAAGTRHGVLRGKGAQTGASVRRTGLILRIFSANDTSQLLVQPAAG